MAGMCEQVVGARKTPFVFTVNDGVRACCAALQLMMDNTMSRASDVYSFGIIMYELLTFKIPFDQLGKEQVGLQALAPAALMTMHS